MKALLISLVLLLVQDVTCQRRELESDIKGIASAQIEVIPDNPEEQTTMSISLMLTNIIDYDTKKQVLDLNAWLAIHWTDARYSWDPASYGNISTVSLPCHDFVKPDVKLYNGAEEGMRVDQDVNCVITSDGGVSYIPLVSIHSFCPNADPTDDTFICKLDFGSWTHPCHDLNITRNTKKAVNLEHFGAGWRWQIMQHSASFHEKTYSCCPHSYCSVEMVLKIRDRSRTPRGRWYYPHCL